MRKILSTLALSTAITWALPAYASEPSPTVLTSVIEIDDGPSEAHFLLHFAGHANPSAPVGASTGKAALGLALTTRGNAAVSPANLHGLVQQITFDQADTILIVRFATNHAAAVSSKDVDSETIEVTISSSEQAATAPSAERKPLPAAQAVASDDVRELVMLKYADVSEVVGVLTDGLTVKSNDTFTPREPGFGSTSLTGGSYAPSAANLGTPDTEPLGQSVDSAIAIDRRLNAVWLKGSREKVDQLKAFIAQIDIPVDSVLLETQIVELDENGASALGLDFTNSSGQIAVATAQSGGYIPSGVGANVGSHLNAAGSVVGGALTSASLQAALYAQVTKGDGKIISRPRIVAQSGGSAKIITGDALPILTAITLSGVNGVSQQVQYVNVGVTLQIAPRISSDGYVMSHVFCVVSSETGLSQGYPTISQREADTQVTVKDGEAFVIGGLTQNSVQSSNSKIPGLGDIPLLGQLFHVKNTSKQKTELYIVVTPHIIHPGQNR